MFSHLFGKSKSADQKKVANTLDKVNQIISKSHFNLIQQKISNRLNDIKRFSACTTQARMDAIETFIKISFAELRMLKPITISSMLNEMSLGFIQMGMPEMSSLLDKLDPTELGYQPILNHCDIKSTYKKK